MEYPLGRRVGPMECLAVCRSDPGRLPHLGLVWRSRLSGALVARRQTLVVQHVVAQLSGRLMGHASISAPLARNWGQLVGKRNLVSRFGQLCHRFRSNLTQKGRCSHPFYPFYIFLSLLKEPKSSRVFFSFISDGRDHCLIFIHNSFLFVMVNFKFLTRGGDNWFLLNIS